jgi:hypothetical protein
MGKCTSLQKIEITTSPLKDHNAVDPLKVIEDAYY